MAEEKKIEGFSNIKFTASGLLLEAKLKTGVPLKITRAVIGTGYLDDGEDVANLTTLKSEIESHQTGVTSSSATVDITNVSVVAAGMTNLRLKIKNGDTPFYLREIGIMAQDPDLGEILYLYTNCGNGAQAFPAFDGSNHVYRTIDFLNIISNASDINVNVTLKNEVTREDFETHRTETVLDHPDGCVTYAKLNADVIDKFLEIENRFSKLKEVDKVKISFSVGSNGNNFNAVYRINFNGTQYPLTTRIIPKIASTDVVYKFYIKYDYETGTFNAMASHNNEEEDEQGTIFSKTFTDSCSCTESFLMIKNNDGYAERF